MQKEEVGIIQPIKKSNTNLMLVVIVIALFVLILFVLAYFSYDYFSNKIVPNQTVSNQTNINDTTSINHTNINDTSKPANSCGNGKCDGKENYTSCPKDCKKPDSGGGGGGGGDCNPNCVGKSCGSNGCSGSCGSCNFGYACNSTFGCSLMDCTNDTGCSSEGLFCSGSMPYNCNKSLDTDICIDRLNLNECGSGYLCTNGTGCIEIVNCTSNLNCSYMINNCSYGMCNASQKCEIRFNTSTTICKASTGVCDATETCTGSSAACPSDSFNSSTTICRVSVGICDVSEKCTGNSAPCLNDIFNSTADTCRASTFDCDAAEMCTGTVVSCPANINKTDGSTCTGGTCTAGRCITCTPQCTGKVCGSDGCSGTCGTCATGQTCNTTGQCESGGLPGWRLVFSDEFNGNTLDTTKWAQLYAMGTRTLAANGELQWYTDGDRYHNVSGGTLKLIAYKESTGGGLPYASGMISSHINFSQAYGYIEGRMKLPNGAGAWPAFWMLTTPVVWPPEIDIFEGSGPAPNWVQMNYHFNDPGTGQHTMRANAYTGPDFTADFHTYAIEWWPDNITWYIDGVQRHQVIGSSGVPIVSSPMHVIANLAIGGMGGDPSLSTYPKQLEIDYMRVYTKCTPQCTGKVCGSDGCGGTCGTCATGQTCNAVGQCVATCINDIGCSAAGSFCEGNIPYTCTVGADGCLDRVNKAACLTGQQCVGGVCQTCTPQCTGKVCGSDGCSGTCGTCGTGYTCNANGQCIISTITSPYVWPNGPSSSPNFFPISVWLQGPTNADEFKNIGINTFVGLWDGPTEEQLSTLKSKSMPVICDQNTVGLTSANKDIIKSWMQMDEPDNAQWNPGTGSYDPCIDPSVIQQLYNTIKSNDNSRPVFLNFGRGVSDENWGGRGTCTGRLDMYPEYIKGADIISYDIYPVTEGVPLSYVARGVDRLVNWSNGTKIVWNWIETTHINNPSARPSADQIRSEVWMSIIHGSMGIGYFVHEWQPSFKEDAIFRYPEIVGNVTLLNQQITGLAPVLNSPTLKGKVTVASPVDTMVKSYNGHTYIFAINMGTSAINSQFSLTDIQSGTVTVLNESRSLTVSSGKFSDSFSGYEVHLYKVIIAGGGGGGGGGAHSINPLIEFWNWIKSLF